MKKISSQQVQAFLKTASDTIRTLEQEKSSLMEKVAQYERRERAEKIASEMDAKGLSADLDHTEKVAHLLQVEDLDVTERAVKLASAQTGVLGNLDDRPGSAGGSKHALDHFILTGEDPA